MPHDDFSFLTGKQADLDNDGYKPQQQSTDEPPKIHCAWGIVGWILALIGCFMPIINTFVYTDGDEIGLDIALTIILLAAWIFGFSNRAK